MYTKQSFTIVHSMLGRKANEQMVSTYWSETSAWLLKMHKSGIYLVKQVYCFKFSKNMLSL